MNDISIAIKEINNKYSDLSFRNVIYDDCEFILKLKELCLKWYIEIIYGWDTNIQREKTKHELKKHIDDMKIIIIDNKDVGVTTFYEEDGEYVGKLMVLLNPKSFSIDKFIEEIEDLLEIEHKKFDDYTIEDVEVPEVVSAEAKAEEVKEETEAKAEEVKEEAEGKAEEVKEEAKAKTEDISEDIEFVENNEAEKIEVVEEKPEEKKEETKKGGFLKFFTQPIGQKKENKPYLQKTKTNEKLYIEKDKFVIGSEDGSDYQIKEETVEAQHAFIVKEKNEFFLVDNESKTGTFMNTAQLLPNEKYVLVQGAHIRIADEEFDFKLHD